MDRCLDSAWKVQMRALLGLTLAVCLSSSSNAHASCGSYVLTKYDLLFGRSHLSMSNEVGTFHGLPFVGHALLNAKQQTDQSWPPQHKPCEAPGCRQLPKNMPSTDVLPNPARTAGIEMIFCPEALTFPKSNGYDLVSSNDRSYELSVFHFRPPCA